jgi:hypothetical protein
MKEEILQNVSDNIKRYGLLVVIITTLYYGGKKFWSWIALPIMLYFILNQIGMLINNGILLNTNITFIIILWIFMCSVLSKFGKAVFEKNTKER